MGAMAGRSVTRLTAAALVLAALALVVMCGGCGRGRPGAQGATAQAEDAGATPVSVMQVRRGAIQEELLLTGSCTPFAEVDVMPEMGGKVVRVTVDVGDRVSAADLLVRLDTILASKQTTQAARGVDSAQARLNQAVTGSELTDRETVINIRQAEQGVAAAREMLRKAEAAHTLTREQTESRVEQAKVGLASAQAQERDVAAGARTQEIAQAEARVRQAESDLTLQKTNFDRFRRLYDQGAVAEATLDAHRTQYEVAQQSLNQARDALSLAREGARHEQRRLAGLGVEQAREQLKQAEAGRRQVEIAARDVGGARVGLRQAEENLRLAQAARRRYDVSLADIRAARAGVGQAAAARDLAGATEGKHIIRAPIAGTVSQRHVEPGESASPGFPVIQIVNNDPIRVAAKAGELDVARIKVGDEGITTVDGIPDRTFLGRVIAVTPQAVEDQRMYIVRVQISNPEGLIKGGMFARVRLVISEKSDVVVVPRDALVERGAERLAYVVEDGVVKIREVKTGIMNSHSIEITSGLSAGDVVVVSGQPMLAEGQRVRPVMEDSAGDGNAGTPATAVLP